MTPTVFDKPQFHLLPDHAGVRMYANVDNVMEVVTHAGSHRVAVAVPTGLFTLMRGVLKVPREARVNLALDELGESDGGKFLLSMMWGNEHLYDLWTYSPASLPPWILLPEYFV